MTDKEYAITNLVVLRENIAAYASFAPSGNGELFAKVEAAQDAVQNLINFIKEQS